VNKLAVSTTHQAFPVPPVLAATKHPEAELAGPHNDVHVTDAVSTMQQFAEGTSEDNPKGRPSPH